MLSTVLCVANGYESIVNIHYYTFMYSFESFSWQGLDSGFSGGSDDLYNVYDKPWRAGGGMADKIYRPSKAMDKDIYGDDVEKLIKTSKWVVAGDFQKLSVTINEGKVDCSVAIYS